MSRSPTRTVTFYGLNTCGTCRKAKKYLQDRGVVLDERPVREAPPSRAELERWIDESNLRAYLNTSSQDYRSQGLSGRELTRAEVLELITATPNLIKRPVVVFGETAVFGFRPEAYDRLLG